MRKVTFTFNRNILIVLAVLLVSAFAGASFGAVRLYQRVLSTERLQQELMEIQSRERLAQEEKAKTLLSAQEQELLRAKEDLQKTKSDAEKTSERIRTLSETVSAQSKASKETVISSSDLLPYMTGVVQIICSSPAGIMSGSGSLFTFKEVEQVVLTNYHVVENASKCAVIMTNTANVPTGMFSTKDSIYTFNGDTDEAVLSVGSPLSPTSVPIANYNYSLASLRKCPSLLPVGTPVIIIGYPAYAKRDSTIAVSTIGTVNAVYRATTNGIISGYDTSRRGDANYFVSAKIDAGNSGGMALAKDTAGLCVLGLPTWLTVGNYETQGLVQNITNVLPSK
jgi:S1-C subfamily serine protease